MPGAFDSLYWLLMVSLLFLGSKNTVAFPIDSPRFFWKVKRPSSSLWCARWLRALAQIVELPEMLPANVCERWTYTLGMMMCRKLLGGFNFPQTYIYIYILFIVYNIYIYIIIKNYIYIYLEPQWPLFLKANPPKTRSCPFKTRGPTWVPGIYIYMYPAYTMHRIGQWEPAKAGNSTSWG